MLLIRFDPDGSPEAVRRLSSSPGARARLLPPGLRQLAVLGRNLRSLMAHLIAPHIREEGAQSRAEENRRLALGVQYLYEADVPGDVAEFGTKSCRSAGVLARSMSIFERNFDPSAGKQDARYFPKRLHLFDSFSGLPRVESEVDRASPHVRTGVWREGGNLDLDERETLEICSRFLPPDRIRVHAGWFRDTLPLLPPDTRFALVHIDCCLYQSARDVLVQCFSRGLVGQGAAVFLRGWNSNRASPELGERRAWQEAVERFAVRATDCGEYGWGCRKFIVHSYRAAAP